MNTYRIDLNDFRTEGAKVFTGRPRGKKVRIASKIDQVEKEYDEVELIIPDYVRSINPSFFEEFLVNVVSKLGEQKFFEKFKFKNQSKRYEYEADLYEAVERILRTENSLSKA
jgi:hypothetical protein